MVGGGRAGGWVGRPKGRPVSSCHPPKGSKHYNLGSKHGSLQTRVVIHSHKRDEFPRSTSLRLFIFSTCPHERK